MTDKLPIFPTRTFMPCLRGGIVNPSGVGAGEHQHIEAVTVLLVGVSNRIRQIFVLLDLPLDSVGGDALTGVAICAINHAATTSVRTQPEQAVVHFGNRVGCDAADFVERALNALQREVSVACVIPHLNRIGAEHRRDSQYSLQRRSDRLARAWFGQRGL